MKLSDPVVLKAQELPDESDQDWKDLFLSCYMGRVPDEVCEVPYVLSILPKSVGVADDDIAEVRGEFDYTPNRITYQTGDFSGTLNLKTNEFDFTECNSKDPWHFRGRIHKNWKLMILTLSWDDGFVSPEFAAVHQDTVLSICEDNKE